MKIKSKFKNTLLAGVAGLTLTACGGGGGGGAAGVIDNFVDTDLTNLSGCLLYTSPSPRDGLLSRMPSSA